MSYSKKMMRLALLMAGSLLAIQVQARGLDEWHFGGQLSYVSGISDVTDLYEKNYNATNTYTYVKIHLLIPVGIQFAANYQWKTGLRADFGVGPAFYMSSSDSSNNSNNYAHVDLHHYEVPVSATIGYSFAPHADVSPYLRAGFAYHIAGGTYYEGSTPGLFAAAGIEFSRTHAVRYVLEAALDKSKVEFDNFNCPSSGYCAARVDLNTYNALVSFGAKF
jgi:hypothetical protein